MADDNTTAGAYYSAESVRRACQISGRQYDRWLQARRDAAGVAGDGQGHWTMHSRDDVVAMELIHVLRDFNMPAIDAAESVAQVVYDPNVRTMHIDRRRGAVMVVDVEAVRKRIDAMLSYEVPLDHDEVERRNIVVPQMSASKLAVV